MKIYFTFALVYLLFCAHAQQVQRCHTDEYLEELKKADPGLQQRMEQARLQAAEFKNSQSAQKRAQRVIITIPVVVHIMHNDEPEGTGANISEAQILSQIEVLNEDYQALNADTADVPAHFTSIIGDAQLEFCLAQLDPEGNPTTGIERISMGVNGTWNDNRKVNTIWDNSSYLNLWVTPISGGTLGYATFPGTSPSTDGVVIDYRYFGRTPASPFNNDFNLGRTATHEIGHWLGLDHTFQGSCAGGTAANCGTQGDRICDTPPTSNPNYGCSFSTMRNTCTETPDLPDMWMNYLDYMDDECLFMFTQEQVDEMRAVLNTSRSGILNSLACDAQNLFSYAGQVVDAQSGQGVPDARVLFIGTGKFELETDANGNFSTPNFREGTYAIYAGKWGYETKEFSASEFIEDGTASFTIPVQSGFYYDDFLLDYGWAVSGNASSGLWERGVPIETDLQGEVSNTGEDVAGDYGDECYVTGNGGGSAGNDDVDEGNVVLSSPLFDLTTYNEPHLSYYRWFFNGGGQGNPNDQLVISLSNGTLTVPLETIDAASSGSEWVFRHYPLKNILPFTNTMQLLVETSDLEPGHLVEAGLDLFKVVDSLPINVGVIPADDKRLLVYPNPAQTALNILFDARGERFTVMVSDMSGKLVLSEHFAGMETRVQLDVSGFPSGVYFIKLVSGSNAYLRKAAVLH